MTSKSVVETLQNRVSIRSFQDKPIPDEILNLILETARRSPTSSNMQSYSLIVVKNPETKKRLAVLAKNQDYVASCPVFIAFCADLYRLEQACAMHDAQMQKSLESSLVSSIDAALVGQSTQTLAESLGLGVVMIGAMRNHPKEVADLLKLPEGVYVVYGMCLGWAEPESVPPQKPRLPQKLVVHEEHYQTEGLTDTIQAYDRELAEHYESLNRNLDEAAWSGPIAQRLQQVKRPELRKTLEALGFSFD